MVLLRPQIIRTNLIILLVFVVTINVDCRAAGRGRAGRVRVSKLTKNKFYSNSLNRQSSLIHKSKNRILVTGRGAAVVIGALALRSFASNNNKASIRSRQMLTDGTGSLCINRENYSNFIFNEFRCPLSPIFTTNDRYCCGAFQQQYCCSFWESGGRTIGAIIGIISACSLFVLFIICCIVYYRRYLKRKGINGQINTQQPSIIKRSDNSIPLDPPPPYSEVITMRNNHLSKWLYFLFAISLLMVSFTGGKGYSGGSRGGGFKGGGGGGGSKGAGSFGGASSYSRANSMGKPRSGSSFKSNAMSFAAGAAGGVAAYSIMRSMSGSYRSRPDGYYGAGYGGGETCVNYEDMNGTVLGEFRCPIYGFPHEAKHCCGEYRQQYCCVRERSGFARGASHFGWIVLVIIVLLIIILLWARRNRQRQKEMMMIPTEPPANDQYRPSPFYQPPPPAAGYPPPPGPNPYAVPPQNFNPYAQQSYMAYPTQQPTFNSY